MQNTIITLQRSTDLTDDVKGKVRFNAEHDVHDILEMRQELVHRAAVVTPVHKI